MTNYAGNVLGRAARWWGRQRRAGEERDENLAGGRRGRGQFPRILVATDLDDTLVDSREPSREALLQFNFCWKRFSQPPQDLNRGPWAGWSPAGGYGGREREEPPVTARTPLLVYVTGRSAERFRQLVVRPRSSIRSLVISLIASAHDSRAEHCFLHWQSSTL